MNYDVKKVFIHIFLAQRPSKLIFAAACGSTTTPDWRNPPSGWTLFMILVRAPAAHVQLFFLQLQWPSHPTTIGHGGAACSLCYCRRALCISNEWLSFGVVCLALRVHAFSYRGMFASHGRWVASAVSL